MDLYVALHLKAGDAIRIGIEAISKLANYNSELNVMEVRFSLRKQQCPRRPLCGANDGGKGQISEHQSSVYPLLTNNGC